MDGYGIASFVGTADTGRLHFADLCQFEYDEQLNGNFERKSLGQPNIDGMSGNTLVIQAVLDGDTRVVATASVKQMRREDPQPADWIHTDDRPSDTSSLLRPAPSLSLFDGIALLCLCALRHGVHDCESSFNCKCIEI